MATKTTKRTTTARKPVAKKTVSQNKVAKVLNAGTETDYKTKYHFMCVMTLIFAVICGILFWAICNKQSDYEDLQNCYADDTNCTLPNKRANKNQNEDTSFYYDGEVVNENAVSAAGQE